MRAAVVGLSLLFACVVHAASENVWQAPESVTLPVQSEPTTTTLELPAVAPDPEQVAVLRFRAWLNTPRPAGWNNYLALTLNGTPLDHRTAGGQRRVLNRAPAFMTSHPNYAVVNLVEQRSGLPCLQVFFGPPDEPVDPMVLSDRDAGYDYLLDISDLLQPGAVNELTLTNTALTKYWGDRPPDGLALMLDRLAVDRIPAAEVAALRQQQLLTRDRQDGPTITAGEATVRVTPDGGMQVEQGPQLFFVETSISYPREPRRGENELSCRRAGDGEPGWQPRTEVADDGLTTVAEGQWYRLSRTIRADAGRVRVRDAITNRTREVLGLAVAYRVITPDEPRQVLLNGLPDAAHGAGRFPEHPTLFVDDGARGLGFLAEDNALRLQSSTRAWLNAASLGTERLGLAPGETYALEWSLYPGDTDPYTFINAVRRDWGVNFTIDGPWDFLDIRRLQTAEGKAEVAALLRRKKLKYFALVPWFEYYNGWGYSRQQYHAMMAEAITWLRGQVPEAKFLACVETNLVPVPLSFFGDTIPADWPIGRDVGGKYGQPATPSMTARIDATPWRDSVLRGADGNALIDCWYVQHYRDRPAVNLMVYPKPGNARDQQFHEQLRWLLDEVGFDGVYIDQFSQAYSTSNRYTHGDWDGRTVTLDAAGRVTEQLGDLGLLSAVARRGWVTAVLDRGKTVVANSLPAVNELQALPAARFMETQGYEPLAGEAPVYWPMVKGQLGSPLGLGHSFPPTAGAAFFMRTVIAHLQFGLVYYYYLTEFPPDGERGGEFGPVNLMFPITPIELHEGWILGRERLLTCRSGSYLWPREERPTVLLFDEQGRAAAPDATVEKVPGGWRVNLRLRDNWQIAVVLPPA